MNKKDSQKLSQRFLNILFDPDITSKQIIKKSVEDLINVPNKLG